MGEAGLWKTTHVQRAVRFMVGHLMGDAADRRSRYASIAPCAWRTSPGSFVAELELFLHTVLAYSGRERHSELDQDPSVPQKVADELTAAAKGLSEEIDLIRLRSPETECFLTLTRMKHRGERVAAEELDASLQGRLMMVDWKRRTAQLHSYGDDYVRLRFDAALDDDASRDAVREVSAVVSLGTGIGTTEQLKARDRGSSIWTNSWRPGPEDLPP